jgi:pimeloyl-ACP methyl ester carboxylesterase
MNRVAGAIRHLGALSFATAALYVAPPGAAAQADVFDQVDHRYADSDGVSIHYALLGPGADAADDAPLMVMVHGFPDFWYTWRDQMPVLARAGYRVAAMDTRGYNLSDQPESVDDYALEYLVADVAAVMRAEGAERAIVVGHDWGGWIAWSVAMQRPDIVERLIVLNLPHPAGLTRELAKGGQQAENSQYARNFQMEGSHEGLTAGGLTSWVRDERARARYVEAFERSSFFGMMAYYKANYPREPYEAMAEPIARVQAPVLQIHGLDDPYLLHPALDGTWQWLDGPYTLVTLPGVGHFVQEEADAAVNEAMLKWLGEVR